MNEKANNPSPAVATEGPPRKLHGVLGEFGSVEELLRAAEQVREAGYRRWEVYSPFPVHGLSRAMGRRPSRLAVLVLIGGIVGLSSGLGMQWFCNTFDYPYVVSGKPLFSAPAFIPVTFELTILLAALAAVGGMLVLNRLPQLYHPLLKVERFRRVSDDRFFIVIEAGDGAFEERRAGEFLASLGAIAVESVEE